MTLLLFLLLSPIVNLIDQGYVGYCYRRIQKPVVGSVEKNTAMNANTMDGQEEEILMQVIIDPATYT